MNINKLKSYIAKLLLVIIIMFLFAAISLLFTQYRISGEAESPALFDMGKCREYKLEEEFADDSFIVVINPQNSKYTGISEDIENKFKMLDNSSNLTIYVPLQILNSYIQSSDWSSYAGCIVGYIVLIG
ncbi:MAG: hypothetical protein J6U35_01150 [Clostridia bacterium]|nr:hypothetical protein [Clostridia bacterium]